MTVICAEPFAVCRVPGAKDLVFGDGEEDVAVAGKFELIQRPFL